MNEGMAALAALIIIGWLVAPLLDGPKKEPVQHIGLIEWARDNKGAAAFITVISIIPITVCTLFLAGFYD